MQLHKSDVVEAATKLLDTYGIADLTMRRLARELEVSPGALYWHFPNKQALLGAVADRVLQPVDDVAGSWRDRVTGTCARLRDALLSHTDGAELVSASFAAGQSAAMASIVTQLACAAGEAGVALGKAELAARTVVYYVLGFTADEQSRLQWDAAGALT
ncbi:TetR family transcriptional regulator, partial [Mycobacterium sp.]|uniref:TetR family transcriptional regulator n=1 Tax=Mycobacterium sp. TaxID=1785 RepID=UPI003C73197C